MNKIYFPLCTGILLAFMGTAAAQYPGWQRTGSFFILTTPEGADLPASATEKDFPLLVRLNKNNFNFTQAKANGEDLRFSAAGKPLDYQIEAWNATAGTASVWLRIPLIRGNARQEIKMHWGKPDAATESNGAAVFNAANGYACVMHFGDAADPVKDETGNLKPTDSGTSSSPGMIGSGRNFSDGTGILGGKGITTFPAGAEPHTTEAWIRPFTGNRRFVTWGGRAPLSSAQVLMSGVPYRITTWTEGSAGGNVDGNQILDLFQWYHVAYVYQNGNPRIYVNGVLDAEAKGRAPMNIPTAIEMYIGFEWGSTTYCFNGDMDEMRVSKVARSADWIKLQYENQKPLQTLAGPLVRTGNAFSVSPASVQIEEGKKVTLTAEAGAAQKIYWVVKKAGVETTVAVDEFAFELAAGRVLADTSYVLQVRAVYPDEVKTREIPITVKEAIPEPIFTLQAPAAWNGRDTIEVVPALSNLAAMKAAGADQFDYKWSVSGGAVIKQVAPGKLILKRSQYTGPITVTAEISNGGTASMSSTSIAVTEPRNDAWVQRTPGKDEKPEDGQFYARDDNNEGTLHYNGTLEQAGDSVFLKVYADDKLIKTESLKPAADKTYAFATKLKAGLIKYKVEFGTKTGAAETVLDTVTNLVCGDAYLIQGQSNALATDTRDESPPETNEWIRSYAGPTGRGDATHWVRDRFDKPEAAGQRPNLWCNPVWKGGEADTAILGWWGMELAKRLLASQKVPIFVLNGAVGGTRIDEHQKNDSEATDMSTIYGKMLWRLEKARLTHGIRGVLWHQGESDQGSDGPDAGYGWQFYRNYFVEMSADWKQDMPNIEHYYLFQIWPNSCGMGGRIGSGDRLREALRTLPDIYSNMDIMSTLGVTPPGPCHFPLEGWSEFARLIQPLIERDFYDRKDSESITAPNLTKVCYSSSARDAIVLEFDQPVIWMDSLAGQFYLDGAKDLVSSGSVAGNVLTLKLKAPATAGVITYLKEAAWSQQDLIFGNNGIAALTFCEVPIAPPNTK